ncbi:hypothetical protein [Rubripirellula reticaptiva]|uniref:Uncharacterized protein n=1 Tax=Rubripirellula reticaptiva TaxID=2528013 RepID=A0A5C6ELI1_9BACT|nr:hypothetical protein [Rubripirellula reticaptiva]TWU48476.1 hypothetical protein Poly59_53240 [Rubripirellula reticaptiva]
MFDDNPYRPTADSRVADTPDDSIVIPPIPRQRSAWNGVLLGFAIGAAIPVGMGVYSIAQFSAYQATLPSGSATCGMPMLGAMMIIFFGGPFGGLIGALVGGAVSYFNPSRR